MTTSNIWDQIESYQALKEFWKTHHQEDLWDGIHPLCEALGTELRAFAEAHPEHELETLESQAASRISRLLLRRVYNREFQLAWLAPHLIPPWSARLATDAGLFFDGNHIEPHALSQEPPPYIRHKPSSAASGEQTPALTEEEAWQRACFRQLIEYPWVMAGLERLDLKLPPGVSHEELTALGESLGASKKLKDLTLLRREDDALAPLFSAPWPRLRSLELHATERASLAFAAGSEFPALKRLKLYIDATTSGAARLLTPTRFPSLAEFMVFGRHSAGSAPPLPLDLIQAIGSLPSLSKLLLSELAFTAPQLEALGENLPPTIEELTIGPTLAEETTHALLSSLRQRAPLLHLRRLSLSNCTLSLDAWEQLVHAPQGHFPALVSLNVRAQLTEQHIQMLCEGPLLGQLTTLEFHGTELSPQSARRLANADGYSTLQSLRVFVNDGNECLVLDQAQLHRKYATLDAEERLAALRAQLDGQEPRKSWESESDHLDRQWQAICEHLDQWDDDSSFEELVLPYMESHLAAFPSHHRILTRDWARRLSEEGSFPALQLVHRIPPHVIPTSFDAIIGAAHLQAHAFESREPMNEARAEHVYRELPAAPFWPRLKHLRFCPTWRHPEALSPFLGRLGEIPLESLVMENGTAFRQPFSHEFLESLATSGVFRTLRTLDLTDTELDAEGIVILSQAEGWEQLQRLELSGCHIRPAGAEALSRCLPASLQVLNLEHNAIQVEGLQALIEHGSLDALEALNLRWNLLDSLESLQQAQWPSLHTLRLRGFSGGMESLQQLLSCPWLGQLRVLELSQCHFTEDQPWTELLASSPALANLEELVISKNRASYAQCQQLARSPHIKIDQTADEWYAHVTYEDR